jgi:transcriptional regulator with XRE-family HTH domain
MDAKIEIKALESTGLTLYGLKWNAQLARELGVSSSHMSKLANGTRRLTYKQRLKLANLIGEWAARAMRLRRVAQDLEAAWLLSLDDYTDRDLNF